MKKMTKIAAAVAALGVMASSLTGCGGGASGAISVIMFNRAAVYGCAGLTK